MHGDSGRGTCSVSGLSRATRLLMRCSWLAAALGLSEGARVMVTSQRSSSATVACSMSASTAGSPFSRSAYRPPPQFRHRARSLPAPKNALQAPFPKTPSWQSSRATCLRRLEADFFGGLFQATEPHMPDHTAAAKKSCPQLECKALFHPAQRFSDAMAADTSRPLRCSWRQQHVQQRYTSWQCSRRALTGAQGQDGNGGRCPVAG